MASSKEICLEAGGGTLEKLGRVVMGEWELAGFIDRHPGDLTELNMPRLAQITHTFHTRSVIPWIIWPSQSCIRFLWAQGTQHKYGNVTVFSDPVTWELEARKMKGIFHGSLG